MPDPDEHNAGDPTPEDDKGPDEDGAAEKTPAEEAAETSAA
jgi:hypothetical protein